MNKVLHAVSESQPQQCKPLTFFIWNPRVHNSVWKIPYAVPSSVQYKVDQSAANMLSRYWLEHEAALGASVHRLCECWAKALQLVVATVFTHTLLIVTSYCHDNAHIQTTLQFTLCMQPTHYKATQS